MTDAHPLTLYNSLSREKQQFIPANPKRVTMYNCGPTVYSYAHIGNARAAVVADVLFRVLRHIYGEDHVVYARNITDVDDKIIASAKEQGVNISEITEKYARIYNEDLAAIGCLAPTHQPKATDSIQEMADIIVELLEKDIAYVTSEGHVLFDVTRMEDYGKLSGRKLEDNLGGARVEVAGYKRNPSDFLLWKIKGDSESVGWSPKNLEGYIAENWQKFSNQEIPLTPGRPGWHIECSAMIRDVLGETIDIHCGGIDLKFPHHENEIAQSECANGKPLASFWVHNEFLNMGNQKMSKSLGNVTLIHDLLEEWDGEVIRLALLKAQYRSELVWSENLLKESKAQLDRWYRAKLFVKEQFDSVPVGYLKFDVHVFDTFMADINTTILIMNINMHVDYVLAGLELQSNLSAGAFLWQANLLGLLQKDPEDWFRGGLDYDALVAEYDSVRAQALAAKAAGDKAKMGQMFARSDELRDQFKSEGIIVETADGKSSWRKA